MYHFSHQTGPGYGELCMYIQYFIHQFMFMTQYFIYYTQMWYLSGLYDESIGWKVYLLLLLNQLVNRRSLAVMEHCILHVKDTEP